MLFKKRKYITKVTLHIARYIDSFKCYLCNEKIKSKEEFYDGGHGYRYHKTCAEKAEKTNTENEIRGI